MILFVPTPIGNLEDISFRAIKALEESELIFCEDTRVTKKLINLLDENLKTNITTNKQFISIHSHNEEKFLNDDFKVTLQTKNVVYVSDAGMPCISDPGAKIVNFCIENKISYDILPGANALLVAFAMSGFLYKEFIFQGFLPHKSQNRKDLLSKILLNKFPTILYESPHRIEKLIDELMDLDNSRIIFVVKELTKIHQKICRGTANTIKEKLKELDTRGEWVVIIDKSHDGVDGENISIEDIKKLNIKPKEKAKLLAKMTGKPIKEFYEKMSI